MTNAQGYCKTKEHSYVLVDIPGTYSLMAHSRRRKWPATSSVLAEATGCGGCDATCLERNLNLVLQTMEISDRVLVW